MTDSRIGQVMSITFETLATLREHWSYFHYDEYRRHMTAPHPTATPPQPTPSPVSLLRSSTVRAML